MRFSPTLITTLILEPLRYFFSQGPKTDNGLYWHADEKISNMDIGTVNDFHKLPLQKKPRILVNRGNYAINKSGLTDSLTQAKGIVETGGKMDKKNMVWVDGAAQIIIEANQEGTCELMTDMVTHFIAATRPLIMNTLDFNDYGLPMNVSTCDIDKEDTEKFKVVINVPYRVEDHWQVTHDSVKFKSMYITLVNDYYNPQQTKIITKQS